MLVAERTRILQDNNIPAALVVVRSLSPIGAQPTHACYAPSGGTFDSMMERQEMSLDAWRTGHMTGGKASNQGLTPTPTAGE